MLMISLSYNVPDARLQMHRLNSICQYICSLFSPLFFKLSLCCQSHLLQLEEVRPIIYLMIQSGGFEWDMGIGVITTTSSSVPSSCLPPTPPPTSSCPSSSFSPKLLLLRISPLLPIQGAPSPLMLEALDNAVILRICHWPAGSWLPTLAF